MQYEKFIFLHYKMTVMLTLTTATSLRRLFVVCLYAFFGFFMICLPAYASPSEGMRYKTLSDVMDEYMRTKTPASLVESIGEPKEKDPKYRGYSLWRYRTEYRRSGREKVPCQQLFIIENSSNRIVGWRTDCEPNVPKEMYGEIAATTPIPDIVTPEPILAELRKQEKAQAQAKAEAERAAEAAKTRLPTFSDWLATLIGQSEEKIFSTVGAPTKTQNLSSGKTINVYVTRWNASSYSYVDHIAWNEGWGNKVSGVTYSTKSCSFSLSFQAGKVAGYNGGDCQDFSGNLGKPLPYKTPVAPWSTY